MDENEYYPAKENIFRVFEMPVEDIKVVILGQDPYPNPNQSIGLAFAVSKEIKKPASLKMIEREVGHPLDRTLQNWIDQGVFLLNVGLTVKRGQPGSHIRLWHPFTINIIKFISEHHPVIWMLWGKFAEAYAEYISKDNDILYAAHPAAETYRQNAGFLGCDHFNYANVLLKEKGKQLINW